MVVGDSLAGDITRALSSQKINASRYSLNGPCFYKLVESGSTCDTTLKDILKKANLSKFVIISSDFTNERSEVGAFRLYKFFVDNGIETKIIGAINFKYLSSTSYKFAKYNFYRDHKKLYFKNRIISSNSNINQTLKKFASENNLTYLNKEDYMCDIPNKECDYVDKDGYKIFYDYGHYTEYGARYFGKKIYEINWLKIN